MKEEKGSGNWKNKGTSRAGQFFIPNIGKCKRTGAPLAIVLAGISETHKLFSADGKFFTRKWAFAMANRMLNRDAKYASVHVSRPISTNTMNLDNLQLTADNLMIELSSFLPLEERGMYKDSDYLLKT